MPTSPTPPTFIWSNAHLDAPAAQLLAEETSAHQLSCEEGDFDQAVIAFGQPGPERVLRSSSLRWVHITSAGYTPYDTPEVRAALREKGVAFTNSSHVYDEPCAQHVLAMMLALSRGLLPCYDAQKGSRDWDTARRRAHSELLLGQTVLLLGFGAIARRLAEMLRPFGMKIIAVRRRPSAHEGVEVVGRDELARVLPLADHVVNALPHSPSTDRLVGAACFERMKPGARFYNIGRGQTVDQEALLRALSSEHLGTAYLDVTDPEPLPPEHALWSAPNCFITPHSGGGHANEHTRLVRHFARNLRAWEAGEPLHDRVSVDEST
jgi:phosphoglycerate dehydrogenase-like enzyme